VTIAPHVAAPAHDLALGVEIGLDLDSHRSTDR